MMTQKSLSFDTLKLSDPLPTVEDLVKNWDQKIIPSSCYFHRFDIIPEAFDEKDSVIFWVEWKNRPSKEPERTLGVVLRFNSTDTSVDLWVERKLAKKKTLTKTMDADPIKAMKQILTILNKPASAV